MSPEESNIGTHTKFDAQETPMQREIDAAASLFAEDAAVLTIAAPKSPRQSATTANAREHDLLIATPIEMLFCDDAPSCTYPLQLQHLFQQPH